MDLPLGLSSTHLLLAAVALVAGFIDAVAGGGGMLTVPSLMFALPDPRVVLGTNKGQSVWGTAAATVAFARAGKLDRVRAPVTFLSAATGSFVGARMVSALRPEVLRPVVLVLLVAAAAFVFARSLTSPKRGPDDAREPEAGKAWALASPKVASALIGLVIGAYDGFFGPGTGTFLIVLFSWWFGDPLDAATANAKVANLASNLAALLAFAYAGKVDLRYAAPMAVAQLVGGSLGARATLRGGERVVRIGVLAVTAALTLRLAVQMLG
ncbi:MAG: TSUP family transporter [Deltaproteobacteria bacterium]|nr:TSUP family transporter [Deltaproteobacteria bacterium]